MNKKPYVLSVVMSLLSILGYAQVGPDIIRPSVNADQFNTAIKVETALSKGQLSLSIPLMELKGKGYDLPISLTFYNGDVTFCTEASPVGLGWSLMAGGVITKTIRGSDDYDTRNSNKEHLHNGSYILDNWEYNDDFIYFIQEDPMPDEYTYSLPGHSGTIDISINGDTLRGTLYPDESYKFEPTDSGFCITADDGTKFFYETSEKRTVSSSYISTSWFLSRILTTKGGLFSFNYAEEEYVDLSTEEDETHFEKFRTKRIASIVSDFGSVTFDADIRYDRGGICDRSITNELRSKRINKIELRDENNILVKGYELDNSGLFESLYADPYNWCDRRHKLSSITQYDAANNQLPPYEFTYSYKFSKSKLAEGFYQNGECMPRDSWSGYVGSQAYVDLKANGDPSCYMMYPNSQYTYLVGITIREENIGTTASDYFCLTNIDYPNGATEEFTYEDHHYSKVNLTDATAWQPAFGHIQGKRLAMKKRYGSELVQETDYVYTLHDSGYNVLGGSSGVITNPSIHCATCYTPGIDEYGWKYHASRLTLGKAFNSFMGPPVCYTEVEEVERDESSNVLNRTIHYFEPQIVSPPVNYICMRSYMGSTSIVPTMSLIEVGNRILGTKSGYIDNMAYLNNENMTYMTYPLAEFYSVANFVDQPLKEVLIGRDGDIRSITEYSYSRIVCNNKYGYKVVSQNNYRPDNPTILNYTSHMISMSEYNPHRFRLCATSTTRYYDNGNSCDSICDNYTVAYNKGRIAQTSYTRSSENRTTNYYFAGDIMNIAGNSASPEIEAMNGLVERNIVADPVKTVLRRNDQIVGGECKDYQMLSGIPMLKSVYKLKNTDNNYLGAPAISGNSIDYLADLYIEGEIMTYDEYHNPEYVRLNNSQDRIYVWGYGGRFPIAVIDDMDYTTFQAYANLKSQILQLATYRKIETENACAGLRSLNANIRSLLPGSVHITTYTYDPYFGMTSEIDDSNLGTIYTYDTFGRLSAKYDVDYRKLEEYNYHYSLE